MPDKRTHQLTPTSVLTGKYVPVSSDLLVEDEGFLASNWALKTEVNAVIGGLSDLDDRVTINEVDIQTNTDDINTLQSSVGSIGSKEYRSGVTTDTSFALPANCKVVSIDFKISTDTMTVKVGTTVSGNEVVYEESLAVGYGSFQINRVDLGGNTLYFTISGSGSLEFVIYYQENWFA